MAKKAGKTESRDGGPTLYAVVVLTRRGAQTSVSVHGPTTSRKTAEAAEQAYTEGGAPAQLVEMEKLPMLRELRGERDGGSG